MTPWIVRWGLPGAQLRSPAGETDAAEAGEGAAWQRRSLVAKCDPRGKERTRKGKPRDHDKNWDGAGRSASGPHLTLHVLPFTQTHTPRESLRMAWVRRKIKIPELLPITGYSENRQAVSSGHFWLAKGQLLSSQKG